MPKTYTFYCPDCNNEFWTQGKKTKRIDPIYGPCWKRQAECPSCGQLVDQKKKSLSQGDQKRIQHRQSKTSCATGACPFAV